MSKDEFNAKQVHGLLVSNLRGLDSGQVTVERANAVARLGTAIFNGARARLKIQTQAGGGVSEDLRDFAK